jgi:hypothetical protein
MHSMLTDLEREYARSFASREYRGQGAIVDLGCWFGSATIALASGLRLNPNRQLHSALVHAYDLFVWEAWMDDLSIVRGTPLEGKYKPGESFLEESRQLTGPWKENIRFYPGDLTVIGWCGGPIEFLFVDAMKSWQLTNSIIHDFYPSLIPGSSIVVQQDFASFYVYWIHLITHRFQDYFQPIYDIPYSSSLVFKYVKQIPESLLQDECTLSSFSNEEINAAFHYAKGLVGKEKQPQVVAAKLRCFTDKGDRQCMDEAFFELSNLLYELPVAFVTSEQSKHQQLTQENDRLRVEMGQLRSELNEARGTRDGEAEAVAHEEPKVRHLAEENDFLKNELERLRLELTKAQAVYRELPSAAATEGEKIRRLTEENDHLRTEVKLLQDIEAKLHNTRADLWQAGSDLGLARSRISAMESSKFWKLRHQWFRVKRALHLPGWETE